MLLSLLKAEKSRILEIEYWIKNATVQEFT